MPTTIDPRLLYDPQSIADQQSIDYQRQLATMLLQDGTAQGPSGQMIGPVYVGNSPMQGMAKMFQTYMGNQRMQGVKDRKSVV
jgi:hypothetical protein